MFTNAGNNLDPADGEIHIIDLSTGSRDYSAGTMPGVGRSVVGQVLGSDTNGITFPAGAPWRGGAGAPSYPAGTVKRFVVDNVDGTVRFTDLGEWA